MADPTKARILIIDDDEGVVITLTRIIESLGLEADHALTLTRGMEKINTLDVDLVLLDVNLPDGSGLDAIEYISGIPDPPQIIILTAFSDPDGAELAIENGAWDYIQKPASSKAIKLQILRALEYRKQKQRSEPLLSLHAHAIIGSGRALQDCLKKVSRIARTDAHVLLTGETGTGKELFAKAIHENSARAKGAFIVVDCSILSENFIESVLFGHEKGAFTGADRKRNGLALLAHGGTLFLDEVGELPESIQGSFLRVLQEKKFRPVGSEEEIHSDFRVISATNKNIEQMAAEKKFRNDLLYRLKSFSLELPPLRHRRSDIREIAFHYTDIFCRQQNTELKELSDDFLETLEKYDWPGNVRELVNTMETCIASTPSERILFAYHLPSKIRSRVTRAAFTKNTPGKEILTPISDPRQPLPSFREAIARTEQEYMETLYSRAGGDIEAMCRISGISRAVLYRKLKTLQTS
ncbi:MAG: sigma-54 dependent transcriptional regulator [Desulfobacula sp.]|nr:sigma-54 dependent transcriptional regulator [Desulfobacula sp.]